MNPKLREILVAISYNGGTTIPEDVFTNFMNYMKKRTVQKKIIKNLRTSLLYGELSSAFFKKEFEKFLIKKLPSQKEKTPEGSRRLYEQTGPGYEQSKGIHPREVFRRFSARYLLLPK